VNSADIPNIIIYFLAILYEAMPFIALGAVIAGFLEVFVPQKLILRFIPQNRPLAIVVGCFLGVLFPMCECGILVIMRRLIRKGVPLSVGVAYMLAGPIINFVVMLSTYKAFQKTAGLGGLEMMALRMTGGFVVAFGTALIVEWQHRRHGDRLLAASLLSDMKHADQTAAESENGNGDARSFAQRIHTVAEVALHDFVDITVFLILGALLASLARVLLPHETVEDFSRQYPFWAIGGMMALAIILCLCSEADAFVAASFTGLAPSAKLAFLVLGPMLDFKLYMMYLRVFSPRLIWTIIVSVVVQVWLYALVFHLIWESMQ
jgi:uncharacterized membrane protein YraQ (UPF0718 family)